MPIDINSKSKLITSRSYESLYSSASSRNAAKVLYQHRSSVGIKQKLLQKRQKSLPQQQPNDVQPQCCSTSSSNMQLTKTPTSKLELEQSDLQKRLSARFLRVKSYQNQLTEAQHTIDTLHAENRMLRTLHQRQDVALAKYEAANDDLPKLINSHAEEVRVWEIKCCNIRTNIKELEERLHKKEALIYALTDQKKYFAQLNKNKLLEERQNLSEQRQALESQLADITKNSKQVVWRLEAELRHLKQLLSAEQKKVRLGVFKMEKLRMQLGGFKQLEKTNVALQKQKTLGFIKEEPELTETSVNEDTDTAPINSDERTSVKARVLGGRAGISNMARRQKNLLAVEQEVCHTLPNDRPSQSTISEDLSSMQSYDDEAPPTGLTEDEGDVADKRDADLNSVVSACSFSVNMTTDESVTEDDSNVLEVVKSTSRLKRDISDLRGKMNTEYKAREGFLDNYSLLASNNHTAMLPSGTESDNAVPQKVVMSVTQTIQKPLICSGQNNHIDKLLASLKSIDITNNV